MRKISSIAVVCGLALALTAGCGSSAKKAASSVTSTSAPSTTVVPSTTTVPPTVSGQLGQLLITPDGFAPSISSDVTNGPVDAAAFDKEAGTTGVAADLGYVGGYDVTYDAITGDDYVEVALFQFYSPAQATSLINIILRGDKSDGDVSSTFSAIPGATAVRDPVSDGTYEHDVLAMKNNRIMAVAYTSSKSGPVAALSTIAINQYKNL